MEQPRFPTISLAEFKAKLLGQGIETIGTTPEAFAAILREEIPRWAAVVKSAGIKSE